MMCAIAVPTDQADGGGPQVTGVRGLLVVLEGLVMRNVIANREMCDIRIGAACTACRSIRILLGQVETRLKPAPGYASLAQHLTDISSAELQLGTVGARAEISDGIAVSYHGALAFAAIRYGGASIDLIAHAIGLPGNQIDSARRRWSEDRTI